MDDVEGAVRPASTPRRSRSLSTNAVAGLAPSPTILEKRGSRDDHDALHVSPSTPRAVPRRPDFLTRGLTLQLPPRTSSTNEALASSTTITDGGNRGLSAPFAVPLSPKLVSDNIFMHQNSPNLSSSLQHSPATSLPRHSRGLDFSRACTTLHHSTVIDQSSPGSSPVITQRALNIPARKMSISSIALDSPNAMGPSSFPWAQLGNGGQHPNLHHEKSTLSSSVGSANMMGSDSESTSSDGDTSMGGDDTEDPVYTTPQVHKLQNPNAAVTPFALNAPATPSGNASTWGTGTHFSPAQASLMKTIRRTRLHKNGRRSRKSSSSASGSGYNSMSPRTASPPAMRSIETATGNGYFPWMTGRSRRESLAVGADGPQLSSGNDSGDEAVHTAPSTPGVVRRAVTRRGNLLPKTKGFARIRAALAEEATPVDTEVRREAETIRQVRERDGSVAGDLDLMSERPQTATAASSPNLLPAVLESAQEDFGRELEGDRGLGMNFAAHASRNSGGMDYWNRFDPSMRTPPPPNFARNSSSALSDVNMDLPGGDFTHWRRPRARSSASDASEAFQPTTTGSAVPAGVSDDMHLKKFKRRREDDFDIATIKRRAVSPGMSAQNSPVLANSPSARDNGIWGHPPERKEKKESISSDAPLPSSQSHTPQLQPVRTGSGGSIASGVGNLVSQGKKLGLQPMADTNDGLMKMSIE